MRHKTPPALLESNRTPLQLELLGHYMKAAEADFETLQSLYKERPPQSFLIQAGTRGRLIHPTQPSTDELIVLGQRERAAKELLKIVEEALRFAKGSKLKIPPDGSMADGIHWKALKDIHGKADSDYNGDISRVVDMVRCTILANNIRDLQILSELFRPCANPNVVRFRNEFNRVNPEKGDIRRLHINVAIPEADGHVVEILVFFGPSVAKYDLSRQLYGTERAAKAAAQRGALRGADHRAIRQVTKIAAKAGRERSLANKEAADFPEIRGLLMDQRAYLIDGFPVVISDDAERGQLFALVPNPASGFWETDQRFLNLFEDRGEIAISEASLRGQALMSSLHVQQQLGTGLG